MRKIYYSFLMTIAFTGAIAQQTEKDMPESANCTVKAAKSVYYGSPNRVTIWSEDFAGGFPAGWTIQDISGICPWRYSTDGSWGYYNGNNATAGGTAIASTTALNGFLICDPDSANNAAYGQPSGTTYQYLESYFTTTAIDCSGYPNVLLQFQQFFRYNNSPNLMVMVSNDSTNWTTWNAQGSVTNNTASLNADQVSINISSVAGGQSTVYLKIGWSSRVYYWMIDDLAIVEAADDDCKLVNTAFQNVTPMSTGSNITYTIVQKDQVAPVQFKGDVVNNGALAQNNCNMNVEVVDAAMNNYYTGSGTATTLNPGDSLHALASSFTPAGVARDYDIHYALAYDNLGNDANVMDNNDTTWLKVTNGEYGRDNNTYSGGGLWNGAGNAYLMGNAYQIMQNWTVNTIRAAFASNSDSGVVAYAEIYEIDAGGNFNLVVSSSGTATEKTIQGSDISTGGIIKWVDFEINPTNLSAGSEYIAVIGHYGGADDLVIMNGGVSPAQTTFLLDGTDNTWYYLTSCPMVRLAFSPVGIEENSLAAATLGQNIPNPANDNTRINFNLTYNATVSFEVVDIAGKRVYARNMGTQSVGEHWIDFNVDALNSGVYFYSVIVDGEKITRKMIVE